MAENVTNPIVRRGVASARGTQRLKFTEKDANRQTGLFEAHLDNVDVSMIKIGEDRTGMPSFNGLEIPRLRFTFASNDSSPLKRKYVTLSFNAVESNVNTIPGGKEAWKVENVNLNWINHIVKVFVCKGKELNEVLSEEQIDSLNLPFVDYDENGDYVPIAPEDVIAGWKSLFESVVAILTTGKDGTPYYMHDGKFIPIWIKLIRCVKNPKKGWQNVSNGDLAFPTFVGEGCIEYIIPNTLPSIHIDPVRESIMPKVIDDKPKAPNMPGAPTMPGMSMGGVIDAGMSSSMPDMGGMPFYSGVEDIPADLM
mgnify:FL=1